MIEFGKYRLDLDRRELYKGNQIVELTYKEYLLLEYLVVNKNVTLSKAQILDKVWGTDFEGYDNTVMVHIRKLREKIEQEPSKPRHIITVKGRGYRFEEG
jgi:DNA-binding response OmpR family regulator